MIACLAALVLTGASIIEVPDSSANYITMQAIVKIGHLDGEQQAMAQVIDDTLTKASENFNQDQLQEYSTLAGESMRCTLSADHFRVQLEVPQGRMSLGAEILADELERPRFEQDDLDAELLAAPKRPHSLWAELLAPYQLDFSRITRQKVLDFFHKIFVPDATTIVVGGAFSQGEGDAALEKELSDWVSPKPVPLYGRIPPPEIPPGLLAKHSFPISTIELYGPEYSATDSSIPAQLLVATTLGVGKASSMHQILRERLGRSYEQSALVEPTPGGFSTHLVMMVSPNGQEQDDLNTMRTALLADVQTWSEATRERALGMARAYLINEAEATPLFFDSDNVIGSSLEERTFLQGYWQVKAGEKWDSAKLLDNMGKVSLDQMKALASTLLTNAQGSIVLGK